MSGAEYKVWQMPELVEKLLGNLDVQSISNLAEVHPLTLQVVQGSRLWKKLLRRSIEGYEANTFEQQRIVVQTMGSILCKMDPENQQTLLLLVLEDICAKYSTGVLGPAGCLCELW